MRVEEKEETATAVLWRSGLVKDSMRPHCWRIFDDDVVVVVVEARRRGLGLCGGVVAAIDVGF